ncbi:1,3-beta-glucan synthase [Rhizoctonia solani AG-3 Rhs1AP]|uniref:1,3-beta-glucan synthase n=1 Tax=Rhizoctonia solani AG-3 Rhs1AP TaxID=1086054 RepID=X8J1N9_9AGAM|nr:1,3-beta-glucan synthase [Rhizoctonia solani AG-3 Rhs1AP]
MVIFSVQVFIISLLFLSTLMESIPICKYADALRPDIIPIFLVFMTAFLRLFIQELTERGAGRNSCTRTLSSTIGSFCIGRRITGYKKKRLSHPSEKLSSDVPRAGWRAVLLSEIIAPLCLAVIFTVAHLFAKSFPQDGAYPPSPFVRLAIASLGPIVWNAAVLLVQFPFSPTIGLMLNQCCPRFGAVMAMVAHSLAVVGLIAFFEFLWFLESWSSAHAVLCLIAIISTQRAIQKILISVFISREFKHG